MAHVKIDFGILQSSIAFNGISRQVVRIEFTKRCFQTGSRTDPSSNSFVRGKRSSTLEHFATSFFLLHPFLEPNVDIPGLRPHLEDFLAYGATMVCPTAAQWKYRGLLTVRTAAACVLVQRATLATLVS